MHSSDVALGIDPGFRRVPFARSLNEMLRVLSNVARDTHDKQTSKRIGPNPAAQLSIAHAKFFFNTESLLFRKELGTRSFCPIANKHYC
jgi:hypothetical protein